MLALNVFVVSQNYNTSKELTYNQLVDIKINLLLLLNLFLGR